MEGTKRSKPIDFTFRPVRLVLELLQARGVDGRRLMTEAGLPEGLEAESEPTAPLPQFRTFMDAAAAAVCDPHFGLTVSRAVPRGTYALVEFITRSSANVGEAMQSLARYGRIINAGVDWAFLQRGGHSALEHRVMGETCGLGQVLNEYTLAFVFRAASEMVGERWRVSRVYFAHPAPKSAAALTEYFKVTPAFSAGVSGFELADELLGAPFRGADPELKAFLEGQAKAVLAAMPSRTDLVGQVRHELVKRLGKTDARVEVVSEALGLSARTLQRRLEGEGTSFQGVLDEVREQLAMSYLVNDALAVSEIAYLLGYSELRAFDRAFRRWTGKTPVAFRNTRKLKA